MHFLQSDEKAYFDVGHDGREYSIGLDLKEMFALAQTRSVYPHKDSTNTKNEQNVSYDTSGSNKTTETDFENLEDEDLPF